MDKVNVVVNIPHRSNFLIPVVNVEDSFKIFNPYARAVVQIFSPKF
jgi:hypothetical protein